MNDSQNLRALPLGEKISDYVVEKILGQGGFGITYLASDVMLDKKVAIKEYYPREYAVREGTRVVRPTGSQEDRDTFKWGLTRFLDEARVLARFDHSNIIAVRRFFEANGTAYLVMDYCEGASLDEHIKNIKNMSESEAENIFFSLLSGLQQIHKANFLHRDIKPANIYIKNDGSPVLLDFGSARQSISEHSRSVTSMATAHYASAEQYSTHGKQGPWTDIYGLSATMYRVLSGVKPQDAPDRMLDDKLIPLAILLKGKFSKNFLQGIDRGLAIKPLDRPQSISEWKTFFSSAKEQKKPNQQNDFIDAFENKLNESKRPDSGKKKSLIYLVLGGVTLFGFVLIFNKEDNSVNPAASNKISVPQISANPQVAKLEIIKGDWYLSNGNCTNKVISIYSGANPIIGYEDIIIGTTKVLSGEIKSITLIDDSTYRLVSKRSDGTATENDYKLQPNGFLKLVRRVSISSSNQKSAVALNGKWIDDESATPSYKKCN
jgi:serine/threonine protein kinase